MDTAIIETVRSFNRSVTQRVGALNDHYLSRDRPLGEARVLWEVGTDGCDVRTLRARLELDSGYLSRLLRSLERAGLVVVEAVDSDRRVHHARLTPAGLAERALLDERSDALAAALLEPLSAGQRERLVKAMAEVERLLTASQVAIEVVDPAGQAAAYCLGEYFAELGRRFEAGFDPALSIPAGPERLAEGGGLFLVASLHSQPVGCGALKFHEAAPTEIKRMWVAPSARGLGLGRRLLGELETRALEHAGGPCLVRLETNRALVEAIAMYRGTGYVEVPAFNDEAYAHHWFEKQLSPA